MKGLGMFLNCIKTKMANTWMVKFSFLIKKQTNQNFFNNEFLIMTNLWYNHRCLNKISKSTNIWINILYKQSNIFIFDFNKFSTWINHIIFFIKCYISSFSFNSRYIWYISYLNNLCNTSIMCCIKFR
jgi:hypothetical protein